MDAGNPYAGSKLNLYGNLILAGRLFNYKANAKVYKAVKPHNFSYLNQ